MRFFVSVPGGADVYTISNVLHDWDDEEAIAILATVRAAMPAEATLLVVEHVLDAPGRSFEELRDVHLTDLHMLLLFGAPRAHPGRVRRAPRRRGLHAEPTGRPGDRVERAGGSPAG